MSIRNGVLLFEIFRANFSSQKQPTTVGTEVEIFQGEIIFFVVFLILSKFVHLLFLRLR